MSQARLAELVGTSQPQIKRLEAGERKLTREWAMKLAPALNTKPEELLFGSQHVSVVGYVGAGYEAHFYGDGQDLGDDAPRPPGASENTVAVRVRGDSMAGIAGAGWLLYYEDRRDPPTDDLVGELCIVGLTDGRVLVKTLYRGRQPGLWDLHSTNVPPMQDQPVAWAARVSWIKPR